MNKMGRLKSTAAWRTWDLHPVAATRVPYRRSLFSKLLGSIELELALVGLGAGLMVLLLCAILILKVRAAKKEKHLRNALIRQMEATQQSEKKSMSKSLVFARASHDMHAALAALSGITELCRHQLYQSTYSRSDTDANLKLMEACISDLSGILKSVLDSSRIEAGKMQLVEERFSLEELLEDVVDFYHPMGIKKGIDVILDPGDGSLIRLSHVKGDRRKLKQILGNLLSNAVKFTSEGHVIVRGWARKPSADFLINATGERQSSRNESTVVRRNPNLLEYWFEVSDTGTGIPKGRRQMVFENYVQVEGSAPDQEGTGLGLGIVQSLVRLMGGEIEIVENEGQGIGTCIRFNVLMEAEASHCPIATLDRGYSSSHFCSWRSLIQNYYSKVERSGVIIFIHNQKRCTVLQDFMRRLEINVQVAINCNHLIEILRNIKQGISQSSIGSSSNSRRDGIATSWRKLEETPLAAVDWAHTDSVPWRKMKFILVVIDIRVGEFHDIDITLGNFRRDLPEYCCSRVIWCDIPDITDNDTPCIDVSKLPSSDLVIRKPLHGSRLYQTIGLLPEFGGIPTTRGESLHADISSQTICIKEVGTQEVEDSNDMNPLKGKRILVVDDNAVGRMLAKSTVETLGGSIVVCESGEKACELVSILLKDGRWDSSVPFSCILMDCEMEGMDGIETTKKIRELEDTHGAHTPIWALTAHHPGDEINKMIQAGADGYITKPLTKETLLSCYLKKRNK